MYHDLSRSLSMTKVALIALLWVLAAQLHAAPKVNIEIIAEKEVVELDKKGKEVKKRVKAELTVPGDILFYTIKFSNTGDEAAKNAQLNNPIPEGTTYVNKSVWGEGSEILFSVDGSNFADASKLEVEVSNDKGKKKMKKAEAEDYKAIRWVINEVASGAEGSVGFSVKVN